MLISIHPHSPVWAAFGSLFREFTKWNTIWVLLRAFGIMYVLGTLFLYGIFSLSSHSGDMDFSFLGCAALMLAAMGLAVFLSMFVALPMLLDSHANNIERKYNFELEIFIDTLKYIYRWVP